MNKIKEIDQMIKKMVSEILKNPQAYMNKDVLTMHFEIIADKAKELTKEPNKA